MENTNTINTTVNSENINGLPKDNSLIDFYTNIDRNYVPVAGTNKILPVEYIYAFPLINKNELFGVRMLKNKTNEIIFRMKLGGLNNIDLEEKNYKIIEMVRYDFNGTSYEPNKIFRLNKENDRNNLPVYKIHESQRNGMNGVAYFEKK